MPTRDLTEVLNGEDRQTVKDIAREDVIDNLTSIDTNRALSAKQGKNLQDSKVNVADIKDDLISIDTNKPLSANQGKVLKGFIDSINTLLTSDTITLDTLQEIVNYIQVNRTDLQNLDLSNIAETVTLKHFTQTLLDKLNGIEAGATADQTPLEIKTAYEGNANTNEFSDAEKTKLGGVEAGATADQTGAEIKTAYEGNADTNAYTDAEKSKLGGVDYPVPAFPADEGLALVARALGNNWEKILGLPLETGNKGMNVTNHGVEGDSFWTPLVTSPDVITADITLDSGVNASIVSPTINDGVTVTVPDGSTLVIL